MNEVAPLLQGKYVVSSLLKSTAKSSVGGVAIGNVNIIAKETVKGVTLGSIDARAFSTLGKNNKVNYDGREVAVITFTDPETIEKSIMAGIEKNKVFGDGLADTFKSFFATGLFSWGHFDPQILLNRLGVYVGEVLVGWVSMQPSPSKYILGPSPLAGKNVKAFHLPTDPSFTSVDSFIECTDGTFLAVSSKFGGGAAASIFSGVLPLAIKNKARLPKCTLKELTDVCARRSISDPGKAAKTIVWEWGCNTLLGLKLRSPESIVDTIRQNKTSPELNTVLGIVSDAMGTTDSRRAQLPLTLSNFFNKILAERLTNDSMGSIKDFLVAKEYWQANLDPNKWKVGELKFAFVKAGASKVIVHARKSPQNDISARQGWVNYEVKKV